MTRIGLPPLSLATLFTVLLFAPGPALAQDPAAPVGSTNESEAQDSNVNTRYIVDKVDVRGIDEARIGQLLRDDLRSLVGQRLDDEKLEALRKRLEVEFPDHAVASRVGRGDESGRVRIVFRLDRAEHTRWIHFLPSGSKLVYHERQGWSGALDIQGGNGSGRFTIGLIRGNNDDLVEDHNGFLFRVETREAGTKRLGMRLGVTRLTQHWRTETLDALASDPQVATAYRRRLTVEPAVLVALTKELTLTTGVSVSELLPLADVQESAEVEHANAGLVGVRFDRSWPLDAGSTQRLEAEYELRAGITTLDSDLDYRRQLARVRYQIERGSNTFTATALLGRIAGRAPLFERLTLGDSSTLRGWNKYELVPIGAERVLHQSVEYRYRGFAYFVDAGSAWSDGQDAKVRLATGVGLHKPQAFLTIGFPLNADRFSATFMAGVRF